MHIDHPRLLRWHTAVLASWAFVSAGGESVPQDIADRVGAKCLDGSTPSYQITRNETSPKWIVWLEGGGWCSGQDERSTIHKCASRGAFRYPPHAAAAAAATAEVREVDALGDARLADLGGIMAQDPEVNPDFHTWNKVFVRHCDGSSFASKRAEPIAVSTLDGRAAQMWLRGRSNFDAVIGHLLENLGMADATEVILSGGSAGGLAVFYHLDHLAAMLPKGVRLTGFPDAGFFLDVEAQPGTYAFRKSFQAADPVWNVTGSGSTNSKCLAAHSGEQWKCLMAPYLVRHIETPLFVLNSAYDTYQLTFNLRAKCIPAPDRAPCTAEENATLEAFYDQFVRDIRGVTDGKPANGVYVDSCYAHQQNVNYCSNLEPIPTCVGWSPLESGPKKWGYSVSVATDDGRRLTPQEAFGAYYRGDRSASVLVDKLRFPNNPSCRYPGQGARTKRRSSLLRRGSCPSCAGRAGRLQRPSD